GNTERDSTNGVGGRTGGTGSGGAGDGYRYYRDGCCGSDGNGTAGIVMDGFRGGHTDGYGPVYTDGSSFPGDGFANLDGASEGAPYYYGDGHGDGAPSSDGSADGSNL
ncbi:MAG TPA: hypothetical protein VGP93_18520, partial [Polyangiaceae bacterium]|nr:hypothetical protein [Polyangiaceae bacterium]